MIIGERGCAGLISFDEKVTWLEECTSDSDALDSAFARLHTGEYRQARMLDAVSEAVDGLSDRKNMRRVVLLVSESWDRGSEAELAPVISAAQWAGVTIYAATYSALTTGLTSRTRVAQQDPPDRRPAIPNPNRTWTGAPPSRYNPVITAPEDRLNLGAAIGELVRLRQLDTTQVLIGGTGGTRLPFAREQGLEASLEKLGDELHAQYSLSFVPEGTGEGYHTLEVLVSGQGGLRVRARPGYWLSGSSR